jgi:hypothetical protein
MPIRHATDIKNALKMGLETDELEEIGVSLKKGKQPRLASPQSPVDLESRDGRGAV